MIGVTELPLSMPLSEKETLFSGLPVQIFACTQRLCKLGNLRAFAFVSLVAFGDTCAGTFSLCKVRCESALEDTSLKS